jgi:hypothetical protein
VSRRGCRNFRAGQCCASVGVKVVSVVSPKCELNLKGPWDPLYLQIRKEGVPGRGKGKNKVQNQESEEEEARTQSGQGEICILNSVQMWCHI